MDEHVVDGQPLTAALPALLDGLPFEQLHHEERRAVVGDVVVEDADRAVVLDGVRRVALAQEARPDLLVVAELRVQHLHRDALAVAVGGGVHGGHPADAEERFEGPLVLQKRADTDTRASRLRIVVDRGRHGHVRASSVSR